MLLLRFSRRRCSSPSLLLSCIVERYTRDACGAGTSFPRPIPCTSMASNSTRSIELFSAVSTRSPLPRGRSIAVLYGSSSPPSGAMSGGAVTACAMMDGSTMLELGGAELNMIDDQINGTVASRQVRVKDLRVIRTDTTHLYGDPSIWSMPFFRGLPRKDGQCDTSM